MNSGQSWIVDAHGCNPDLLRSRTALAVVFNSIVTDLDLHPIAEAKWHQFPEPGGVTGFLLLSESHLSCHTFPEHQFAAFDLYCCRNLADWPWAEKLKLLLGAKSIDINILRRGKA